MNIKNKIFNSANNKILFGVCLWISKHFNCSSSTIRILFILAAIINYKLAIINYIALSLLVDNENI